MSKPTIISGAEFKQFWDDDKHWCESFVDDVLITIDGEESALNDGAASVYGISDGAHISIVSGFVCGVGANSDGVDLLKFFKAWRAKNKNSRLVVEVSKEKEAELRKLLSTFDCVVS